MRNCGDPTSADGWCPNTKPCEGGTCKWVMDHVITDVSNVTIAEVCPRCLRPMRRQLIGTYICDRCQ